MKRNCRNKELPFYIVARGEEEGTKITTAIIRYRHLNGQRKRINVKPALLDDRRALLGELKNAGANLSLNASENDRAFHKLNAQWKLSKSRLICSATGWKRAGTKLFVLPVGAPVGRHKKYSKVMPPTHAAFRGIGSRGSLTGWQTHVARPAKQSSRLVTCLSAVFAAPLLRPLDLEGFGLFVHGQAKTGKTSANIIAGSAIGFKSHQTLPSFDATKIGLRDVISHFTDMVVPIEELGLLDGNKSAHHEALEQLAYRIAGGTPRIRSDTFGAGIQLVATQQIVIATGEHSCAHVARSANRTRTAGTTVRLIDLPALNAGASDIFEKGPKKHRADWVGRQFRKIWRGCARHHGVALRTYLERLIRKDVAKNAKDLATHFIDTVQQRDDDFLIREITKKFAAIYAGGTLAVRLGILPWNESVVLRAVKRCYFAARGQLNVDGDIAARGLRRFRKRVSNLMPGEGYYKANSRIAVVSADAYRNWFDSKHQACFTLESLLTRKVLRPRKSVRPKVGSWEWAETQPRWPDGSRRRSFEMDTRRL
jgi:hypothetical protein